VTRPPVTVPASKRQAAAAPPPAPPSPAPPAPPPAPPDAAPVAMVAPTADAAAAATGDPAESLPFVEVPAEATLADLVRIAGTCPNPLQRIDLINALASGPKEVSVLRLLREHAKHAHPGVRAAADEGLKRMFGGGWSAKRDIPPPVQPPRSDD
jgi:hypothetical protein